MLLNIEKSGEQEWLVNTGPGLVWERVKHVVTVIFLTGTKYNVHNDACALTCSVRLVTAPDTPACIGNTLYIQRWPVHRSVWYFIGLT